MARDEEQANGFAGFDSSSAAHGSASAPDSTAIRAQLERLLASPQFAPSQRLSRFLRFSVETALQGEASQLKEYVIGVEVFDRKAEYDPRIDPIVRVEARRLRAKLKAYYTAAGRQDLLVIEYPKGSYAPVFHWRQSASTPATAKSIAVLPFYNLSREGEEDYLSDGLTEELIHQLTRVAGLRVVAWHSASQLRGREQDVVGVRAQLQADLMLRGSIRRLHTGVRITAQLIDTASGQYLWSEAYERDMHDLFRTQQEIACSIVGALRLSLSLPPVEGRAAAASAEAYDLYLQGRFHWNKRTPEGFLKSAELFTQASAWEPAWALPHAGLADTYSLIAEYGCGDPGEMMPRARTAAMRALDLDPECAEACVSLALIRSHFEWDWEAAEVLYRRAIQIGPSYATAYHWLAVDHLAMMGRFEEATGAIQTAIRLDPLSLIIREGEAFLRFLQGDLAAALQRYELLREMDAHYYKGYSSTGRVLLHMGRYDEAVTLLERARTLAPRVPNILGALTEAYVRSGRRADAETCLQALTAMPASVWVSPTTFAVAHLALGDKPRALVLLEQACEQHSPALVSLKVHPVYDPLRNEPRFQAILRRIGLAPSLRAAVLP